MRVEQLPENQLESRIEAIVTDTEELKTRQLTGSNNLIIFHNKTGNTWDIDETVSGTLTYVKWRVTFVPGTVDRPFTQFQYEKELVPSGEFNQFSSFVDPDNIDSSSVSYIVEMLNNDLNDSPVRLKFAFKSLDTGSLSYARVAES